MNKKLLMILMAMTAISVSAQRVVEWRGVDRTGT